MLQSKILITGSHGFIGKFVLSQLASLSENDLEVITWNVDEMGSFLTQSSRNHVLNSVNPDIVLHLAWADTSTIHYDQSPLHFIWAEESVLFMEECEKRQIWFIGMGSAVDDWDSRKNYSSYVSAKIRLRNEFERLGLTERGTFIRPQYVISVDRKRPRVLAWSALDEECRESRVREPDKELDFIDVRDLATGIVQVLLNGVRGIVEMGSGRYHVISDLIEAVKLERIENLALFSARTCRPSPFSPVQLLDKHWLPLNTYRLFNCSCAS